MLRSDSTGQTHLQEPAAPKPIEDEDDDEDEKDPRCHDSF